MGKKVKSTISYFMNELLIEDGSYFDLERGAIGNRLFKYYSNKDLEEIVFDTKNNIVFQFNLSKENDEMYFTILKEHGGIQDAEYIRRIIFTYSNNPRYKREEILFDENFRLIEKARIEGKKINFKYNGTIRRVNPYFIRIGDVENKNYLFCYCEKNNDYRAYSISRMYNISISKEEVEIKDEEYISKIYKNFDPFLSAGHFVKVKLTDNGVKLLNKVINNRPNIIKEKSDENNNIYVFECHPKLAEIYFSQFFLDAEILEPVDVREKFKEKLEQLYFRYKNK